MDSILLSLLAIWLCVHIRSINALNILAVFPHPCFSHFETFRPLLERVVSRGFNLTLISDFGLDESFLLNYTQINWEKRNVNVEKNTRPNKVLKPGSLEGEIIGYQVGFSLSEKMLQSPEIQDVIRSNSHFDLIIIELFHANDALFAFGSKFNAPVITVTSQILFASNNWILSNPFPSAHVSYSFLPFTEKMSLVARIINAGFVLFTLLYYELVHLPKIQDLINRCFHFQKGNEPRIGDITKNISVSFVNTHYSLGYTKPDLPNVINVAGIHFTELKPLPKEIQKFMDEATDGVIYFSFGSILKPDAFGHYLGETLVHSLKNLPQRVIMKWNPKLLSDIPSNFLIQEWLPQNAILNHPKCRLFITHGGYLSLLESLNASVPVIGIPFFGDQFQNVAMVEYYQIGLGLNEDDIRHELPIKVKEVLTDSRYKRNMEKRSLLFHDRPDNPLDTAMFWIDYVIKHKDISHMKPISVRQMWYELYCLDLLLILIAFSFFIVFSLKYVVLWTKKLLPYRRSKMQIKVESKKLIAKSNLKND